MVTNSDAVPILNGPDCTEFPTALRPPLADPLPTSSARATGSPGGRHRAGDAFSRRRRATRAQLPRGCTGAALRQLRRASRGRRLVRRLRTGVPVGARWCAATRGRRGTGRRCRSVHRRGPGVRAGRTERLRICAGRGRCIRPGGRRPARTGDACCCCRRAGTCRRSSSGRFGIQRACVEGQPCGARDGRSGRHRRGRRPPGRCAVAGQSAAVADRRGAELRAADAAGACCAPCEACPSGGG